MRNLFNRANEKRRHLGGARVSRRPQLIIPAGQIIHKLDFYDTTMRIGPDGDTKDMDLVFSAKGKVEESLNRERIFRHVNIEKSKISHIFTIAFRSALRDAMIIAYRDDLFAIVASTEILAQARKYQILGVQKTGDKLLDAAKA